MASIGACGGGLSIEISSRNVKNESLLPELLQEDGHGGNPEVGHVDDADPWKI